ncbi:MAG: galactonate dehydratase [Dehalococcoidia bacterium]|nr:galactonate dehydratase [Dehalococcoidia bacterium]|tara:strand:+ start:1376 stop:2524 length:1149 start_codon:yes stop_codon:yes gene_type:complete
MKITDIKIFKMSAPTGHKSDTNNWLFVKIYTDAGIHGVGEGSLQYKDAALEAEILDFGKFLIDKDPFQIEYIWNSLYRRVTWTGGAVTMSAISAIDIALWDIKGKALDVPVYELLGGKVRENIPVYANGWFEGLSSPEDHSKSSKEIVDSGYKCLKFYPFIGKYSIENENLNKGVELVKAVRDSVGENIQIGIDIRARLDYGSALKVLSKLEPYNISWVEEPVQFDNVEVLGKLAQKTHIPISTGEQLFNKWEYQNLFEQKSISIIQPDICHAGGLSELKKISSAAETYYVSVAPHNSNGPISTIASLHLDMNIPNCYKQEIFVSYLEGYKKILTNNLIIEDGFSAPPSGSGLGTDINEKALEEFPVADYKPVESEPYMDFF